jgi:acyl-CoA dehydrogenase
MDLTLPEDVGLVREVVRRYVRERLRPLEDEIEEKDRIDEQLMATLQREVYELGFFAYNVPAELGGPGTDYLTQCVISEEHGRTTMPLTEAFGNIPESVRYVSDEQREWFLGPIVRAEKRLAYALTEPAAGSDLSGIETRAVRKDGEWVLNGAKQFISGADAADYILVLARTRDGALRDSLTTFIVDRDTPGFSVDGVFRKMGWRGHQLAALSFADCRLTDDHVLGEAGRGFEVMMASVNAARLWVASRCVGTADELLRLACDYATQRTASGKPLADHQAIQFKIADIDTELAAARLLVYAAADAADRGDPSFRIAASRAKLYASEMAFRAADEVMQIFGGAGYMADFPVERMFRDVRAFRIGEGTSEIQRIQLARRALSTYKGTSSVLS